MQISGDNPNVTPELRAFLESLEFKVDGPQLSVVRRGFRDGIMKTVVGSALSGIHHLKEYGFNDWPYLDASSTHHAPAPSAARRPGIYLQEMFGKIEQRPMTAGEMQACRDEFTAAAAASPLVREWARSLDFEALHAFDSVFAMPDREQSYAWIANNDLSSVAMKRFARDYPLLAGIACYGTELLDTAARGRDPDDAYARIIDYVTTRGFPCSAADDESLKVGPLPVALLDALYGKEFVTAANGLHADNRKTAVVLELARQVPPHLFPRNSTGFTGMAEIGEVFALLRSEGPAGRTVETAIENGYGFGMKFTDFEVERAVSHFSQMGFENLPAYLNPTDIATALARYGVWLGGNGDFIRDYAGRGDAPLDRETERRLYLEVEGAGFHKLKQVIVNEGLQNAVGDAADYSWRIEQDAGPELMAAAM